MSSEQSALLLQKQLKELQRNPVEGFSAGLANDNIYEWEVLIMGPADTIYEGGFFKALLSFPRNYPQMPPTLKFTTEMWHPNG
ncbi:Ubiquitin-conjugating enzyme E2 15, variant 2 [Entomophthora muscae]|uniref:Ubiquitin-conjugating enzyme E2 15, variant 2 n=1 Tax=Entomophthora muscae TaxID=34485 RepID=A0ACC2S2B9_9FUNG|nr:Ubiquitin-conjugating enzyme E2 15, variant 2 [Entomophthora muscae]